MWRAHPGNLASDAWTDLRRTLDALLEAAHEAGVRLGIEPEPGNVVRDARTAARLLAELGHDAPAGIVLDPANLLTPETISRQSELLAEAVDLLGPRVVGIQAKDVAASGAAAAAGAGLLDSPVVLGQLARLPPVPLIVQDASEADAARVRADLLRWSARRGNSISSISTGPTVPPCSVAPPSSHGGGYVITLRGVIPRRQPSSCPAARHSALTHRLPSYVVWSVPHSGESAGVPERQRARHSGASQPSVT